MTISFILYNDEDHFRIIKWTNITQLNKISKKFIDVKELICPKGILNEYKHVLFYLSSFGICGRTTLLFFIVQTHSASAHFLKMLSFLSIFLIWCRKYVEYLTAPIRWKHPLLYQKLYYRKLYKEKKINTYFYKCLLDGGTPLL